MSKTIKSIAIDAEKELRLCAPRARERTLCWGAVALAIQEHLKHARAARRTHPEAEIVTTECGGHVANSYRYPADTDYVEIRGGYVSDLTVTVRRKSAQHRVHGRGDTRIVRRRAPGQKLGVIIASR